MLQRVRFAVLHRAAHWCPATTDVVSLVARYRFDRSPNIVLYAWHITYVAASVVGPVSAKARRLSVAMTLAVRAALVGQRAFRGRYSLPKSR